MWYLSLLFILFLIIIFTYFVKEYRRYRLELDKTLLEYHSYVVKMDKLEKENIQLRRELAIEKNAAKERKEKVNQLKAAFLANISHEIRTPLNAIVGFSNLLIESKDVSERRQYAQIISANNELLLNLVDNILVGSGTDRIESESREYVPSRGLSVVFVTTISVGSGGIEFFHDIPHPILRFPRLSRVVIQIYHVLYGLIAVGILSHVHHLHFPHFMYDSPAFDS